MKQPPHPTSSSPNCRHRQLLGRGIVAIVTLSIAGADPLAAQLAIEKVGVVARIDFSGFAGAGFAPDPSAGQLDSDTFAVTGLSSGDLPFGGTATSGAFARGTTGGGVSTNGVYAFELGDGDVALGFQPTASSFTPGTLTLRVENRTGSLLRRLQLSYDVVVRNDQNRANSWSLSFATDAAGPYTVVPEAGFTSPAVRDPAPSFGAVHRTAVLDLPLAAGEALFVRWLSDDVAGTGSRDEIGVDNIRVAAEARPTTLRFFTDEAGFRAALAELDELPTTAANLALAEELATPPGPDAQLCALPPGPACGLTFDAASTGLRWSFRLAPLPESIGLTFEDDEGDVSWDRAISIGDVGDFDEHDFELEVVDGPELTAFGLTLLGGSWLGGETLAVYGAGNQLLGSLDGASIPGAETFLGVISATPIERVELDDSDDRDDLALRDLLFARPILVTTLLDVLDSDGACSVRKAIESVNHAVPVPGCAGGDSVFLPSGLYTLAIPGAGEDENRAGDLDLLAGMTVAGEGAGASILDGAGLDRLLDLHAAPVEIVGVTVQNGRAPFGGGLAIAPGLDEARLVRTVVRDNLAAAVTGAAGGGLASASRLWLVDSRLTGNRAVSGVGAAEGGALATSGELVLRGVTLAANRAESLDPDSVAAGGALALLAGTAELANVTLSGNRAGSEAGGGAGRGGAIAVAAGTAELNNVTLHDNEAIGPEAAADSVGGGLVVTGGEVTVGNSIIAGNRSTVIGAGDCHGELVSAGHNLFGDATGCAATPSDLTTLEPLLAALAPHGHFPLPGSPALDNGSPADPGSGGTGCEAIDQRGVPRPSGGCDVGAVEALLDLAITKEADRATAVPGVDRLTYTLVVTNRGERQASATVADTPPPELSCTWSCSQAPAGDPDEGSADASCPGTPQTGALEESVVLPVDGALTYTASCTLAAGATGTLTNVAKVVPTDAPDNLPDDNRAAASTVAIPPADLAIVKTSQQTTLRDRVSYTLVATNHGPGHEPSATVTDSFPPQLRDCIWTCRTSYDGARCSPGGRDVIADSAVVLPAGAHVLYEATCALGHDIPPGTRVTNRAAIASGGTHDFDPANNSDEATYTTVGPAANLAIFQASDQTTILDRVAYTITATNAGPDDEAQAAVTDHFPPELRDCTWTCSGEWRGSCTPAGSGNLEDIASLPAGSRVTYLASCSVDEGVAPGTRVTNLATVDAGSAGDADTSNNWSELTLTTVAAATGTEPADVLFADGFESGDGAAWSDSEPR